MEVFPLHGPPRWVNPPPPSFSHSLPFGFYSIRMIFHELLFGVARWLHLLFNLLVQLLVGLPLEMVHGSTRIGAVYMAGVLAGSLGTSVFDTDVYLVGASGGVYALLAAHLANVLLVIFCFSSLFISYRSIISTSHCWCISRPPAPLPPFHRITTTWSLASSVSWASLSSVNLHIFFDLSEFSFWRRKSHNWFLDFFLSFLWTFFIDY